MAHINRKILKNGRTWAEHMRRSHQHRNERSRSKDKTDDEIVALRHIKPLSVWTGSVPVSIDRGRFVLKIPEVFSFIDNPDETVATLAVLASALRDGRIRELCVDHQACVQLDLCASVVMDTILLRAKQQWAIQHRPVFIRGIFSKTDSVNIMLFVSGVLRQLGLAGAFPPKVASQVDRMDLFVGRRSRYARKSSLQELAATDLRRYIDRCLSTEGFRLTADGRSKLLQLVTEVLDNAEQHARTDDRWHVIGFFNKVGRQQGGECHIVVFNFGESFHNSLRRSNATEIKEEIRAIAEHHNLKNWYGLPKWNDETLWTLYALQQGITRLAGTEQGNWRGNGTVTMMEFFRELSAPGARMCLVSGASYILFDDAYSVREGSRGSSGGSWKVIAFNKENDLHLPPDQSRVHSIESRFPGTVVSLRFTIDRECLEVKDGGAICPTGRESS